MDTISETTSTNEIVPPSPPVDGDAKEVKLVDVPVDNPNVALNIIVSFLNLAQKRGSFGIDESSKIWECIKMFQQQQQQ
jgi:hypothetical protein